MANKTPYEIRTELLRLAYDICIMQSQAETCKQQTEVLCTQVTAYPTSAPTTDQIIKEAEKLNEFVSRDAGGRDRPPFDPQTRYKSQNK